MKVSASMVVELWQPPWSSSCGSHRTCCEVRHEGRIVRGLGVFRVDAVSPARCRFTWEEQLPADGLYGVLARLSAPLNRAVFRLAVRRFARWVEDGGP